MEPRPTLALTLGDPAGIGPEIMAKALAEGSALRRRSSRSSSATAACSRRSSRAAGWISSSAASSARRGARRARRRRPDRPRQRGRGPLRRDRRRPRPRGAGVDRARLRARARRRRRRASSPARSTRRRRKAGGLKFPGHTELLADLLGADPDDVYTMFVVGKLRIFFLTRHLSLRDAIDALDEDRVHGAIVHVAGLLRRPRRRRAARRARRAEPARGRGRDDGRRGDRVLAPGGRARAGGRRRRRRARSRPTRSSTRATRAASTASSRSTTTRATSPSKTLDFFGTVSATLGLPVIRTSVDHGTAFDLAGQWQADARGQIAALRVGAELAPGALRAAGARA